MPIHVHFLHPLTTDECAYLCPALSPALTLTEGPTLPAEATILVGGRPGREHLAAAPGLRAVVIPYAGASAETRALLRDFPGVALHNLHHNAAAVAELALTLMLAAAKSAVPLDAALRRNDWRPRYRQPAPAIQLAGRTALILGYGAIGRRLAVALRALGMTTLATRRRGNAPETGEGTTVYPADALGDLLPRADALLICLPHTPQTDGLLGAAELALLPPDCVLVNVGRAAIIDEAALYEALRDGRLRAAGLDVWYSYPPDEASRADWPPSAYPFGELDNVVLSPHRGGATEETPRLRMTALAEMLNAAAAGEEMGNRVDLEAGY